MVGGERAEFGRHLRAMEVRKLLGVELDRQAEAPRRLEDAADLRRGKADVLAKAVDRVGQPGGGDGGDHFLADESDIGFRIALKFGRSEEHTSELKSLIRSSYAVFCLKKKKT